MYTSVYIVNQESEKTGLEQNTLGGLCIPPVVGKKSYRTTFRP